MEKGKERGKEEIHTEAETKIHRNHPSKSKTKVKGLALEPAFLSEMKGLAGEKEQEDEERVKATGHP